MGTGHPRLTGTVATFDGRAGTGTIAANDGATFPFHCIEVADGTRTIAEGTRVTFERLARLGRYQAGAIVGAAA